MEILQGAISAVVYQNYDNGYAVLRLNVGGGQTVTVVGTIPLPAVGERLMVTGKWSNHSSYGRQFEAEFLERLMPQTSMEILSYLSSRASAPGWRLGSWSISERRPCWSWSGSLCG